MTRLLEIGQLYIGFEGQDTDVVRGVSLSIGKGEIVGLAGASGSGKSLTAWSVVGLLPYGHRTSGSMTFCPDNLSALDLSSVQVRRRLAGRHIAVIPQNPFTSLNPVLVCGDQVSEMLPGKGISRRQRIAAVTGQLRMLGFEDPERIMKAYPFELSGGQLQRVVIAMATIADPDLIIADEPTTALDVETEQEVLKLLYQWAKSRDKAMLLISHNPGLLKTNCDRMYLMRSGEIIAEGTPHEIFVQKAPEAASPLTRDRYKQTGVLCSIRNVSVRYHGRRGDRIDALRDVSFDIHGSGVTGLIGATGSGKSTIARILTGLVAPYQGTVLFEHRPMDFARHKDLRRSVQLIFQDPYSALYPHLSIGAYLREAIRLYRLVPGGNELEAIRALLRMVQLPEDFVTRYPDALSGGERQRVQIARAIALQPRLLICDECTSGLDHEVQDHILSLLRDIRSKHGVTLLMISHDLRVIRQMADYVVVIDKGAIVESRMADELFSNPQHPVTRRLLSIGAEV